MSAMRTAFVLLVAATAWAQAPRGWDSYQVIMWSTGAPSDFAQWAQRLKEMNVTAEELTAGNSAANLAGAGLGFYVENTNSELFFLNSRKSIYDADWSAYTSSTGTHDKINLVRKPSLHDPAVIEASRARAASLAGQYAGQEPLLYDLRDELSIGSLASPMDYCFGPHTLAEFRGWLQEVYGTLEALNAEWETSFASWDEVEPMTTYEVKVREKVALDAGTPENYAPWADHRAFMDLTMARTLDGLRGAIREVDGITPVGIEGLQMPSAWGGYDLWRMSQAVDWVEPYNIAGSREVFRSFLPQGTPILSTLFGSDFNAIRRKLWWSLLHGDRGVIVWDDDASRAIRKTEDGMPFTERGQGLAGIFEEVRAAAPQIFNMRRTPDPIAIHYSQASIRAHWMFDSREDRNTWPRRFSSYEATHSRLARARDGFMRVVEDLGLQYNFVSYEQIESGELANYKVLLLPESVAMSEREASAIEEFVKAGGTVIADHMTATMDEHGRRLERGRLDALFGIERKGVGWRVNPAGGALPELAPDFAVFEPDITAAPGTAATSDQGAPALIENAVENGRAVYLNLDMRDYGKYRLTPPRGNPFTDLFARLLKDAGIEPAVRVVNADDGTAVPCVEVWRYRGEDGNYAALMRNPEFETDALQRDAGYPGNAAIEEPVHIKVLAFGREYEADLDPWRATIVKLEEPAPAEEQQP